MARQMETRRKESWKAGERAEMVKVSDNLKVEGEMEKRFHLFRFRLFKGGLGLFSASRRMRNEFNASILTIKYIITGIVMQVF